MQIDTVKDHFEFLEKYIDILKTNNNKVVLNLDNEDESTILRVFKLEKEDLYCVIYNSKYNPITKQDKK